MQFVTGRVEAPIDYDLDSLRAAWSQIHSIDQEPAPSPERLSLLISAAKAHPLEAVTGQYGDDLDALSDALWAAWLAFHNGEFQLAYDAGVNLGAVGAYVSSLALNTYATYLAPKQDQADIYMTAANRAREAAKVLPVEVNIEYAHAFNLGRYAETVSIAKAMSSGAGLAFKKSLETCLEINNQHVPSLLAQGALFAQVIDAIGELAARMSLGATRKKVLAVFEQAVNRPALPPVVYLEYAKHVLLLERNAKAKAEQLLSKALAAPVYDPLDVFDKAEARALLESL